MRQGLIWVFAGLLLCGPAWAYDFMVDGLAYNILEGTNVEVTYCSEIEEPDEVLGTVITSSNSYSGDVVIPAQVTYNDVTFDVVSVGSYAFYNCLDLTSLTLSEGLLTIEDHAFANNYNSEFTELVIPNTVTEVGEYAFGGCYYISSLTLGESLQTIGAYAFKDLRFFTELVIPESVTSIGDYAFGNCKAVQTVTMSDNVTELGEFSFYNCTKLESLTLSANVTAIPDYCFCYCSALTSLTLGENVSSVGYLALAYCTSMTSLKTLATSVPKADEFAFERTANKCTLYVPYGTSSAYQSATGWSDFTNIEELEASGLELVAGSNKQVADKAYNLAGQRVSGTTKGLIIKNGIKISNN